MLPHRSTLEEVHGGSGGRGADGERSRREPAGSGEGPGGVSGGGADIEGQRDRVEDRRPLVLGRELRTWNASRTFGLVVVLGDVWGELAAKSVVERLI